MRKKTTTDDDYPFLLLLLDGPVTARLAEDYIGISYGREANRARANSGLFRAMCGPRATTIPHAHDRPDDNN